MSNKNNKFSFSYQLKSFGWAFKGLSEFFKNETKAIIHSIVSVIVIISGILLKIGMQDWLWILSAITLVFLAEIINTAIEEIANTIPLNHDEAKGKIKDLAAGAVLFASIYAIAIGVFIFLPKIVSLC